MPPVFLDLSVGGILVLERLLPYIDDILADTLAAGLLTDDDIARLDETTQQEIAKIKLINEMMRRRK